ncbi:DUF4123 domain-containing protein [Fibrisoma montanum]|uniref:DUF4123 domain-containing protein n=1 Tax=Fibrisoma montanum TaxID=2305895 RepID=A0A418MF55_9BACT|nr:DUF4123 domain-containing protein [Fibrisoma montanum]RIV25440.1 DUF4123 domain-containing protein [Fibrisoma montanum]
MLYHLLDAAKMSFAIDHAKELNPVHNSLYRGQSQELLASIAPYLFQYELGDEFDRWLRENYGESWGVGIIADVPMDILHKHFRKFLLVKAEDGRELYFRFYDPRVLRVFLPTCDAVQLQEFFGPVRSFFMEDENPEFWLHFWLDREQLMSKRVSRDYIEQELAEGLT